ncbi:MAG: right-handed parallel beta-helix repeat-containing protein [Clostridia bacterium]|nr:right-handed parallel beta-helix repeat-containing protein [Clostridia bacterium]
MDKIILSPNGETSTLQDAVTLARKSGVKRIVARPGLYFDTAVTLDEADNGLTVESDGTGEAVFFGSTRVSGFEKDEATGFLKKKLDFADEIDFRMISANGKYLRRARFPHEGYFQNENQWDVPWMSTFGNGWKRPPTHEELTTLIYKPEDIPADFKCKNAEIIIYHEWDESFVGVSAQDKENHTFTLSDECGHPAGSWNNHRYVIFNTAEGMQAPLDWYFDKEEKTLYVYPDEERTADNLIVMVPVTRSVVTMNGCKDITLKHLSFEGCTAELKPAGFGAERTPGAIDGKDVENILLNDIDVRNSGGMGVRLRGRHVHVTDSSFHHLGSGGVWLGINDEYLYTPYEEQERESSSSVENCVIHHTGLDYFASIGVFVRHANVIGNRIYHTPYMGINTGGDNTRTERNVISDVMCELNDGAAIYTIGYKNGLVRDNIIYDIHRSAHQFSMKLAIYLDEHSENWVVERNLIYDCDYPFQFHMNFPHNTMRDNTCINENGELHVLCTRSKGLIFENNIFKAKSGVWFNVTDGAVSSMENNVFRLKSGEILQNNQEMSGALIDTTPVNLSDSNLVSIMN